MSTSPANADSQTVESQTAESLLQAYATGQRNFSNASLTAESLSNADLKGADLSYTDFSEANLSHANLRGADLSYASLRETNLTGADLRGAMLLEPICGVLCLSRPCFRKPTTTLRKRTFQQGLISKPLGCVPIARPPSRFSHKFFVG